MKKSLVVKVGGSLLFKENGTINTQKISEFCEILKKDSNNFDSLVIVCGGGILARNYINAVREFGGNEALCDLFGIEVSRINGMLFISCLEALAFTQVPKTIEELSVAKLIKKIVVIGGLQPGQSTTSVAVEVAEYINAETLIVLTDVNGIYDKDPNKFKDAKLFKNINYDKLQEIIIGSSGDNQAAAGEYRIFDAVSLQILKRSKIKVLVVSGKDLKEFKKFLNDEKNIIGTVISY